MGRGTSKAGGGGYNSTVNQLADSLVKDIKPEQAAKGEIPLSNSDLQAVVEAFAMTHKGVNEDKMLNDIRDLAETKAIQKDIRANNTKAFDVEMNGDKVNYVFMSKNGNNYYAQGVGAIPKPTPNNMSASEMMSRAKSNGAKVDAIKEKDLVEMYKKRNKERKETNEFLNRDNVRNRGGDITNKAYRNYKKATRLRR